jgi:hypothetical protein
MKTAISKPLFKTVLKTLDKQIVKRKQAKKTLTLERDPFFSSPPIDLGRTNNEIIDEILYGKNGA